MQSKELFESILNLDKKYLRKYHSYYVLFFFNLICNEKTHDDYLDYKFLHKFLDITDMCEEITMS
jgi:hypothetical protein